MAYCVKCGTKVDDTALFCPQCGEKIPAGEKSTAGKAGASGPSQEQEYTYYQGNAQAYSAGAQAACSSEECFDAEEARKNRAMGVLSYLGILVLIPLLAGDKSSEYVRHHANQGLVLFIASVLFDLLDGGWVWGLHSFINFGGTGLSIILDIGSFACFIMMIIGIVYACQGKKTELPVIGKVKILKR